MPVKKILLVEDDTDIRENMVSVLEYEGYQVVQAHEGAEALKILESNLEKLPEVILLDLFMPVMNGREFIDTIEAHPVQKLHDIPIVLITASEENVREDLEARTTATIRKPIDLKAFLNLMTTLSP